MLNDQNAVREPVVQKDLEKIKSILINQSLVATFSGVWNSGELRVIAESLLQLADSFEHDFG